jgi:hypothetical protein
MNKAQTHSSFLLHYLMASNAVSLSIYTLGAVIVVPVGWGAAAL